MTIPSFQEFMKPVLQIATKGEVYVKDAVKMIADHFQLNEEDRSRLNPSSKNLTVVESRASWAVTYLAKAGLVKRTRRGHFTITDLGKEALQEDPPRIDRKFLLKYDSFREFATPKESLEKSVSDPIEKAEVESTPEEIIDTALADINAVLREELLDCILQMSPAAFENLVLELMSKMGYGVGEDSIQHTGKSGDGGIDGIINQDILGLDSVYLQAKRYHPSSTPTIGASLIREFSGALMGKGANKGVFITTTSFSKNAREHVARIPQKLILIDGDKLTNLLMQNDVGVRVERELTVKKIDRDYFDDI